MSTITSLKLGSVPITEEGVERYRFSDNVENHFTKIYERSDDLNCSVGRVFSKMKVPVSWFEVMNANYLIADMEINNPSGSTLHIKGWIDSIDLISDSEDYPQVEIRWHFDYYEMYKSTVDLGYGHVKRRPFRNLATTPIQNYSIRYNELGTADIKLLDPLKVGSTDFWWIIVSANRSTGLGETRIETLCFPVRCDTGTADTYYYVKDYAGSPPSYTTKKARVYSLQKIYSGLLDEMITNVLDTTPESINGVWISPISPVCADSATGTGSSGDPLNFGVDLFCQFAQLAGDGTFSDGNLGVVSYRYESIPTRTKTFTSITSSEEHHYILTDTNGTKILELPYGFPVSTVNVTLVIEPDGPYFEIAFKDSSYGGLEGLTVNIPLTQLPMNSNSYTSYVYSGKQDYDREMRTVQSNANAWKSSASGGGTGAIMGALGPMGLIAGAGMGVAPGLINYGVEMLYQNDEEQRLENRLQANQSSTLILTSNSLSSLIRCYSFVIKDIVPDSYSGTQITNMRNNFGVSVDEILTSCDNLVRSELPSGYYSIKNLIISGAAPKEAKDYIKNKFDAGVKLL